MNFDNFILSVCTCVDFNGSLKKEMRDRLENISKDNV